MSKFKIGDPVRVTNPKLPEFDQIGKVLSYIGLGMYAVRMLSNKALAFHVDELILADPDVHTVLDEMDAEGAPCITAEQWSKAVTPPNRRAKTLRTAESLINGDRAAAYGHPSENFGRIASLWNAQFGAKLAEPFTAEDVALSLVHLKMSRLANTPGHEDSLIDACGYLALASEIANPDV